MVLPPYRAKGYGTFLGELSYEIARRESMIGTPERPLSLSGKNLFRKVWQREVVRAITDLENRGYYISVNTICKCSGLIAEDVLVALQDLGIMFSVGKQGPLIVLDDAIKQRYARKALHSEFLQWVPS
ncbi:acetyltransferase [Strigomonas culicis]|nr:acetyltransferase [Strigomonas culicis]|eukprot:EPY31749.1 acetyltransferase [Strigomonas culicis]